MGVIKKTVVGTWRVSTIQTFAGGARDERMFGCPFSLVDYADDTPWPYETMVFHVERGSIGHYHEPHESEAIALARHEAIVSLLSEGKLEIGKGVIGEFGNPSTTPEEWAARST